MVNSPERMVREGIVELVPALRRFALVLARNSADADDLVQAGLERALSRASTYRPEYKLETWMFKIMQNLWFDDKRRTQRTGTRVDVDAALQVVGEDGRRTTESRDLARRARATIAALPDEHRAVVGLVLVNGESYRDAADVLGVPVGTVMSRLFRARQKIMRELDEPADGESE